jgi:tetratricopeptide (TPR) repeat protein
MNERWFQTFLNSLLVLLSVSVLSGCHKGSQKANVEELSEQIRLHPDDPDLYYMRAIALGLNDQGLQDLQTALRLNPEHLRARSGIATYSFSRKNYDKAIREYSLCVQKGDQRVRLMRGLCFEAQRRYVDALSDYRACVDYDSMKDVSHGSMAECFQFQGDLVSAIRELDLSSATTEDSWKRLNNLSTKAMILAQLGELTQAQIAINSVIHSNDSAIHFHHGTFIDYLDYVRLGVILFHQANYGPATTAFQQSIESGDRRGISEYFLGAMALIKENLIGARAQFAAAESLGFHFFDLLKVHVPSYVLRRQAGANQLMEEYCQKRESTEAYTRVKAMIADSSTVPVDQNFVETRSEATFADTSLRDDSRRLRRASWESGLSESAQWPAANRGVIS